MATAAPPTVVPTEIPVRSCPPPSTRRTPTTAVVGRPSLPTRSDPAEKCSRWLPSPRPAGAHRASRQAGRAARASTAATSDQQEATQAQQAGVDSQPLVGLSQAGQPKRREWRQTHSHGHGHDRPHHGDEGDSEHGRDEQLSGCQAQGGQGWVLGRVEVELTRQDLADNQQSGRRRQCREQPEGHRLHSHGPTGAGRLLCRPGAELQALGTGETLNIASKGREVRRPSLETDQDPCPLLYSASTTHPSGIGVDKGGGGVEHTVAQIRSIAIGVVDGGDVAGLASDTDDGKGDVGPGGDKAGEAERAGRDSEDLIGCQGPQGQVVADAEVALAGEHVVGGDLLGPVGGGQAPRHQLRPGHGDAEVGVEVGERNHDMAKVGGARRSQWLHEQVAKNGGVSDLGQMAEAIDVHPLVAGAAHGGGELNVVGSVNGEEPRQRGVRAAGTGGGGENDASSAAQQQGQHEGGHKSGTDLVADQCRYGGHGPPPASTVTRTLSPLGYAHEQGASRHRGPRANTPEGHVGFPAWCGTAREAVVTSHTMQCGRFGASPWGG